MNDNLNELPPKKRERKPRPKTKVDLDSRPGRYFLARKRGLTKKEARDVAGYGGTHPDRIEASQTYQVIARTYKDVLLGQMSLDQIASEHIKVIKQDIELHAKNNAIKMAIEKIEPEVTNSRDDDRLVVILKTP